MLLLYGCWLSLVGDHSERIAHGQKNTMLMHGPVSSNGKKEGIRMDLLQLIRIECPLDAA